jgi:phosphoglycolate phosphatase
MVNKKPTALLFDWDNTLVDTWPLIHRALHATQVKYGASVWDLEKVKAKVGKSLRDSFPEMFGDIWEEAGAFYTETYRSFHKDEFKLLPQVDGLLEFLVDYNVPVGLVSNKMGESLRREVNHMGLGAHFQVLIGAGDAKRDKPYADPAALALEKLSVPMNEQVWFIGDTITDLGCAKAGGMTGVLYGDVVIEGENRYLGHDFAHHVKNHHELIALLNNFDL